MTSSKPSGSSFVYVIGPAGSTRVKIGTSNNPEKRLKELQTGNPDRLGILWSTPGGRELESMLHRAFAAYRVEGEWFDFGGVEPVGAIPSVVQAHASPKPRGQVSAPRPGARPLDRGESITPERLAGIVRDVVLGVVRNTDDEDEDEGPAKPRRLDRVDRDFNRLAAFMFRRFLTALFEAKEAGKTGIEFVGGWRSVVNAALRVVVGLPVAAFLMVRTVTGDTWPVRRLPALAAVGWFLWDPMGLDKLIREQVFTRLPMHEIESFTGTYFSEAANTGAWCLAGAALLVTLFGYSFEAERAAQEHRAARKAVREKATAKAARLPDGPLLTQLAGDSSAEIAAAAAAALAMSGVKASGVLPPSPSVADLTRSMPRQSTGQEPLRAPVPAGERPAGDRDAEAGIIPESGV
ncbi:GIY-YIG nuclease family protein [Streptomyces sp. NPDC102437]|uniref:GIY-YIG nuclease family protein n=1 Tax=Streptomyces sp. NPDC102437 TaxID=3366175 RepID=UPI00382839F9